MHLLDDRHAVTLHLAERSESHSVEPRVVDVVDEELRRARVGRPRLREGDVPRLVAHLRGSGRGVIGWRRGREGGGGGGGCLDSLIRDGLGPPLRRDLGVSTQSELDHKRRDHAEEARVCKREHSPLSREERAGGQRSNTIIKPGLDRLQEARRTNRRPILRAASEPA